MAFSRNLVQRTCETYQKRYGSTGADVNVVSAIGLSEQGKKQGVEASKPDIVPEQMALLNLEKKGILQTQRSSVQVMASSILGSAYLGWGGALMCFVAGGSAEALSPGFLALLKGALFPVGLSMIIFSGTELLTGNFLTQALPSMRVVPVMPRMRVLALSGVGNIIGSLLMVGGVVAMQIFPEGAVATSHVAAMAATKCSAPIFSTFIKGIGANWLVATAIFQATVAQTGPGKIVSLWMPIATFVALGLEHSVANMFLLPLGMALGADIGVGDIVSNIAIVAAGNAIGAVLFIAGIQRLSIFGPSAFRRFI
eukprot:CAMPEP_0114227670 /NCGR_PEP_ID=MMETSP0058-20121206/1914_1 /TAXON_ID=36894 /ORGANISM="Pyramimonas parkeae, CCMP726" /LENGTH=310 /DNA_ID=CAMNT_0001338527 /DNA_START=201 /DNA_END=1133 /DNA_ORIENTATION=+